MLNWVRDEVVVNFPLPFHKQKIRRKNKWEK